MTRWFAWAGLLACSVGPVDEAEAGTDGAADQAHESGFFFDVGALDTSLPDAHLGVACSGAAPTFAHDVLPIVSACDGELCHGGGWTYAALVGVHPTLDACAASGYLVVPKSIDQSYLMHKLTGVDICFGGQQMPINAPLAAAEIQTVGDWICQGARND